MKKRIIRRYVTQVSKRVVGLFKKKSCGASPLNGETKDYVLFTWVCAIISLICALI